MSVVRESTESTFVTRKSLFSRLNARFDLRAYTMIIALVIIWLFLLS